LQGYKSEPDWWNAQFAVITDADKLAYGNRRWKHNTTGSPQTGMWEYIRTGTIPAGFEYPSGVESITGIPATDRTLGLQVADLPTYNYFSVNIGDGAVSDNGNTFYQPDDVLPPWWNYEIAFGMSPSPPDSYIRSLFTVYSSEVVAPSADFAFGDAGPIEWEWRVSSQFLYDQMTIAFRLDPVRYCR
jgi:hypothetical protein